MPAIPHPSHFIDPELVSTIRSKAMTAEFAGQLDSAQLAIIYQQQWFNLFVPLTHGGLALSLPDALRVEESLAWADGSLGWTVTLCGGAAWFAGFLEKEIRANLFSNHQVCFAGSGQTSGTASITTTGYEINGYWNYASGALHATIFTANCVIEKDGVVQLDEKGKPLVHAFLLIKDEVTLHKSWATIGMIATGSHSFSVSKLQVPANRSFRIDSKFATLGDAIYQYPFLPFAEATIAVNHSGMAMHFLDLCARLLAERATKPGYAAGKIEPFQQALAHAQTAMQANRQVFYEAVNSSWHFCETTASIPSGVLKAVSDSSRTLAREARYWVDMLYPFTGLSGANPATTINQVWRDLHTASQHSLLNYNYE